MQFKRLLSHPFLNGEASDMLLNLGSASKLKLLPILRQSWVPLASRELQVDVLEELLLWLFTARLKVKIADGLSTLLNVENGENAAAVLNALKVIDNVVSCHMGSLRADHGKRWEFCKRTNTFASSESAYYLCVPGVAGATRPPGQIALVR